MFDMKLTFSSPEFEAAWSDFLAVIVSNKLPYQPIVLESCISQYFRVLTRAESVSYQCLKYSMLIKVYLMGTQKKNK